MEGLVEEGVKMVVVEMVVEMMVGWCWGGLWRR